MNAQQEIQALLAQLPEERQPSEWLFSIELGYWLILLITLIIVGVLFFAKKSAKKRKSNQQKYVIWEKITLNKTLSDIERIEQANSIIKLNINSSDHTIKTLNGKAWEAYLKKHFSFIDTQTLNLLSNGHYLPNCKIENSNSFNNDILNILKECDNV